MDPFFKVAIIAILAGLAWLFAWVVISGRRSRYNGLVSRHRTIATYALVLTVLLVLTIEVAIRVGTGPPRGTLFMVHMLFAIPFFLSLLVLRFWVTGIRYHRAHKYFAYGCLATFVGTLFTGVWLMIL
ncbi:MAG TPA: hypothetical protein PKD79_02930 [Candidatus Doudnabacteria bacterium]|nr:hypothetical protein [Candidatus Doudnabacteria bacterium]